MSQWAAAIRCGNLTIIQRKFIRNTHTHTHTNKLTSWSTSHQENYFCWEVVQFGFGMQTLSLVSGIRDINVRFNEPFACSLTAGTSSPCGNLKAKTQKSLRDLRLLFRSVGASSSTLHTKMTEFQDVGHEFYSQTGFQVSFLHRLGSKQNKRFLCRLRLLLIEIDH